MDEELKNKAILYHEKNSGKIGTSLIAELKDKSDLSLAYSPGVGAVTLAINENKDLASTLTLKGRTVAIISDGSAILGLGNLGAESAIPVMEGKAALLKHFADVDAFPICLNTQDPDEIIKIVQNIYPVFGAINLEDISAPRCFYIEQKLRETLPIPIMHDDQWGTATVVLAGIINSLKITNKEIDKVKIVVNGIGAAGVAVSRLLFTAGAKNIIFVDSHGIISNDRQELTDEKKDLISQSSIHSENGDLAHALKDADVFIGLSKPGILTPEMVKTMNEKPIIFALANPVPEIMPDIARNAGAYVVATGRSDFPNQVNNALVFPAVLKAALAVKGSQFNNQVFLDVAYKLASLVGEPNQEKVIPSIFDEKLVDELFTTAKDSLKRTCGLSN